MDDHYIPNTLEKFRSLQDHLDRLHNRAVEEDVPTWLQIELELITGRLYDLVMDIETISLEVNED